MKNGVKIYYVDEIKFYSKQLGNRMWANRKLFNKMEKDIKNSEIQKREVVVCYSLDGLEGLVIIENGACSSKEFAYLIESIITKENFDTEAKSVFFLDNAVVPLCILRNSCTSSSSIFWLLSMLLE